MIYRLRLVICVLLLAFTLHLAVRKGNCEELKAQGFLQRKADDKFQLRVMSWNVAGGRDFPATGPRVESFRRIVRAVKPDVICLQEVWVRHDELAPFMEDCLPQKGEHRWHVHTASDNAVISRFPLLLKEREKIIKVSHSFNWLPSDFHYGHAMCLVDIPNDQSDKDFYVIGMHNRSRSGEDRVRERQRQSDSIVRWIRNVRRPGADASIAYDTPILIAGDMNVLASEPTDSAHHLTTLLTGNIVDEATFGHDCQMDWDGTNLVEVKPKHNSRQKEYYTWRQDDLQFAPGALDRMIYTDSVLSVKHSFVLNTTTMTNSELKVSGLLKSDVLMEGKPGHFDHLPLIADFVFRPTKAR